MKFLAVVIGEIDEIQQIIPNFLVDIINTHNIGDRDHIYKKFQDNGNPLA